MMHGQTQFLEEQAEGKVGIGATYKQKEGGGDRRFHSLEKHSVSPLMKIRSTKSQPNIMTTLSP